MLKYIQLYTNILKYIQIQMSRSPEFIMDLMNGYCKKKFAHSIPMSLCND